MSFKVEGDDIHYETSKNQIILYLEKNGKDFVGSCKCFGTHYLEQTLDDNDDVIKEVIRKNPHHIDWKPPEGHGVFFD